MFPYYGYGSDWGYNGFPYYDDFTPDFGGYADTFKGVFAAVLLAVIAFAVVSYLLYGFAFYRIGKRRGMEHCYLAFIPIMNVWFIGRVADDINATMNKKTENAKRLAIMGAVTYALSTLLGLCFAVCAVMYASGALSGYVAIAAFFLFAVSVYGCSVAMLVMEYIAIYAVYKEYAYNNAVLYLVLSIIFSVAMPFLLFSLRNKKSGYELWREQQARASASQDNSGMQY